MRFCVMLFACLLPLTAQAAGLQWPVAAPDPGYPPLQVAIWYPSPDPPTPLTLMNHAMKVALDGSITPGKYPLIIVSHGISGTPFDHDDTAIALANAGFVVAAVMHTNDNSDDHSGTFTPTNIADRPRHLSRTIDMMLNTWIDRNTIDPARVGVFGFSAGAVTALLAIGGRASLRDMVTPATLQDARIKAAVVAAPALARTFTPNGLADVTVPLQMWVGGHDTVTHGFDYVHTGLPRPPEYHFVPNASHLSFSAPCTGWARVLGVWFNYGACKEFNGFDRATFHATFNAAVIDFFRLHLRTEFTITTAGAYVP